VLKYTKANLFRLQDGDLFRNEGSETKRFSFDIQTQSLNPKQISSEWAVTDELLDVASMPGQLPLQPLIDAVQHAVTKIDQFKEYQIANTIYGNVWADSTAGGTTPSAGSGGWALDSSANSFIPDVFNAKNVIRTTSGVLPNVMIMDYESFIAQQNNPNVSDKIKYTQLSITTAGLLAELLQLDEMLIGRDVIDTSNRNVFNENIGTTPMTSVWSPSGHGNCFLYHREPAGLRALSAGFQFRLPYMGSLRFVRGYRDEKVRSTVYQVTEQIDISPVALDVGYAWSRTYS
jgi:hypothetical protein